jgi:hypothetical protein
MTLLKVNERRSKVSGLRLEKSVFARWEGVKGLQVQKQGIKSTGWHNEETKLVQYCESFE